MPRTILVTVLVTAFAVGLGAQQTTISGVVRDELGEVISGVPITAILEADASQTYETSSGPDGRYTLVVPVGVYRVQARLALGPVLFVTRTGVQATIGSSASVDFEFRLGFTMAKPPGPGSLAVVPVYYATDRKKSSGGVITFDNVRGQGGLRYGRFDVSIPVDHQEGQVERPTWWFQKESLSKHFMIVRRREFRIDAFFGSLSSVVRQTSTQDVLVFIHGFNNRFDESIFRTAQIAYDMQFDGAAVLYSWPSGKGAALIGYSSDRADADWTAQNLRSFLSSLVQRSSARHVYLIAHSMGNYALLRALEQMPPTQGKSITALFLAAPDIDTGLFRQQASAFVRAAQHPILYASKNDRALTLSKALQSYERAGDSTTGIVTVDGISSIDVSLLDTDLQGHAYFRNNTSVISDIRQVIKEAIYEPLKRGLRQRGVVPNLWWLFERP